MKNRSKKMSKILEAYEENRRPSYQDRRFREEAKLYHKYLSKLGRQMDKDILQEELESFSEQDPLWWEWGFNSEIDITKWRDETDGE